MVHWYACMHVWAGRWEWRGGGMRCACEVGREWRGRTASNVGWAAINSGQQTLLMAQGSSCGAWVEWGTIVQRKGDGLDAGGPQGLGIQRCSVL